MNKEIKIDFLKLIYLACKLCAVNYTWQIKDICESVLVQQVRPGIMLSVKLIKWLNIFMYKLKF